MEVWDAILQGTNSPAEDLPDRCRAMGTEPATAHHLRADNQRAIRGAAEPTNRPEFDEEAQSARRREDG